MNNVSATQFRRLIVGIFAAMAASFAVLAYASENVAPQIVVNYSDIVASTPAGAKQLYHRIWGAALTVCRSLDDSSLDGRKLMLACVHQAIADAVIKVNEPALLAVFRYKNPEPAFPLVATTQIR